MSVARRLEGVISYPEVKEADVREYVLRQRQDIPDLWGESFSAGDPAPFRNAAASQLSARSFSGALGEFDRFALTIFSQALDKGFIRCRENMAYLILPLAVTSCEKYFDTVYSLIQRALELVGRSLGCGDKELCLVCMLCERKAKATPHEVVRNLGYNPELARRCGLTEAEVRAIRSEDMEALQRDLSLMAEDLRPGSPAESQELGFLAREISENGVYRSYEGMYYVIIFPPETPPCEPEKRRARLLEAIRTYSDNCVRLGMKDIFFMPM